MDRLENGRIVSAVQTTISIELIIEDDHGYDRIQWGEIYQLGGSIADYELPNEILNSYPVLICLVLDSTKEAAIGLYNLNRMASSGIRVWEQGRSIRNLNLTPWLTTLFDQIEELIEKLETAPEASDISSFIGSEAVRFASAKQQCQELGIRDR